MKSINIPAFGIASAIGGPCTSCAKGPEVIKNSDYSQLLSSNNIHLQWEPLLEVSADTKNSLNLFKKQNSLASQFTQEQLENNKKFVVIGGDHSCAVGTWGGVIRQIPEDKSFALLWIDAHMDAHTLQTSPSGNLHGMPLSLILGEAEHELQQCYMADKYLDGRDLYLFGIRSYEADEMVLLSKEKANVFDTDRILKDGGTHKVLHQLIETIARCYDYYAISLDMDAIDPLDAPGVETREEQGLSADNLLSAFDELYFGHNFLGIEIAEFDPANDIDRKTEKLVYQILLSIFRKK